MKRAEISEDNYSQPSENLNLFLRAAIEFHSNVEAEPPNGSLPINLLKHQVSLFLKLLV